ncbi:uncharacterized protein RZ71_12740 [Apilactobacillus kunkeei]|uniref:Type I restriction modification DNA specificity domain-containing protein n=1 Tax=Apilactobacillus kunkeei TaxID=148814 RepID=A0A0N0CT50_9LACO|nr:restriction endonuclease subunit S [Apilactobacillus kunkeei]KOY76818.1 uncharacterized protein RZ71_12740 [Apilactobacillus kunkeei]
MTKTNVPRLRFKGFDGEWKSGSLGDKLNVVMGQSPHSENYTSDYKQNILVQGNADISNGKIKPRIYTKEITKVSKKNEIIMTVRAPVGELAFNQFDDVVIGRGVASLSGNSFDYFLLDRTKKMGIWNRLSSGSTFDAVNSNDIKSMPISFPKINEQEIIGSFFKKIDKLIELQTKRLEQLKKLKQGYLQKIFLQDGEVVPRLRFSGFKDDWNRDKLENNVHFIQGNDGYNTGIPILTISAGNGWMDQKERFGSVLAGNELKNYTLLTKGQLSYNHGNSKIAKYGAVFCLKGYDKALVPKVYHSFELKNGSPEFLENLFKSKIPDRQLRKLITSGARMDGLLNIGKKAFGSIVLGFPEQDEQQKIGEFFSKLDQLINYHSNKIDVLKKQKKSYLQKMFI